METGEDIPRSLVHNWTRRLIEDPLISFNRRRKVNYHVMQILTGHGIFIWYRHRIGKGIHTSWWDCGAVLDDAVHALVWCPTWTMERADLEAELGEEFKFENLVLNMAADERPRSKFYSYCTMLMKCRLNKERQVITT
jgi:hypothetical protein